MKLKFKALITMGRRRLYIIAAVTVLVGAGLAVVIARPWAPPEFPPLPNFAAYTNVADMKAAFIDYLTPIVKYQNARILEDRSRLERITHAIMNGGLVLWFDKAWLKQLAVDYGVPWRESALGAVASELISRVDIIPVPLVLVQAAKESDWGQSKFAVEGNNLFGQWCFDAGCGVEPEQRPDGATYKVRAFTSVSNAVSSYLHNLNTHDSYAEMRRIRQRLRAYDQAITAAALAEGLRYYSERREAYVEEVKMMIQQFHTFRNARVE